VSAQPSTAHDRWSQLSRSELTALGKTTVRDRLESLGCTVKMPSSLIDGRLEVETPSGRSIEVFVSTQRIGGYAFWTQRRLPLARHRFAAVVLLAGADGPSVYIVPSTDWRDASPPLKNRPNVGKKSEPEFGISLARASLPALSRYSWDEASTQDRFR
jgi:hypothetical protein